MIPDPHYCSWPEWSQFVYQELNLQDMMIPGDEDGWRDWATEMVRMHPLISRTGAPLPLGFDTWRDWAARLNEMIPNA